ncbi:MAG: FtsX-like permease family protein [Candidatus Wallbacteria bacterium]|nr:FtsX-like permease family protein [Candidatus Wallbacteria bacterium]
MRALDRKLLRDLWRMKGQAAAIAAVMACGVAVYVMALTTLDSLTSARAAYYERYRFADLFAHVKRAPMALVPRVRAIPGIQWVQPRVTATVPLDLPGLSEPAAARLVGVPEHRPPDVNGLVLRAGGYLEPGRPGQVIISESFAQAHSIGPGNSVTAVLNGRKRRLDVVGVALSPEFIFQVREGEFVPDNKRYGVFWVGQTELAAAFDLTGSFNDLAITLAPGASAPEVMRRLDSLLAPHGGVGATDRDDQLSHKILSDEMRNLGAMAFVTPAIFLAVAAFMVNVVLNRLIATQREQIAVLKAFGYSRAQVVLHYLEMVLVIVVLGVALGCVAGGWLGGHLTQLYKQFYRFPSVDYRMDPGIAGAALVIAAAAAVLGMLMALKRAMDLPPAEAMRPEPPASYEPTLVERLGLGRSLSQALRMVLREIERRPLRAAISTLGTSLAVAVFVLGTCGADTIAYVMDTLFEQSQRHEITLFFVEPVADSALYDIKSIAGVVDCEPVRVVSARFRNGHHRRLAAVQGLSERRFWHRLIDQEGREIDLPPEGIVLSAALGRALGVEAGDTVEVELLHGRRTTARVPVRGLAEDLMGLQAYMRIEALNRLMREGSLISGAYVAVDPAAAGPVYEKLKNSPRVASVAAKSIAVKNFDDIMAENMRIMRFFNILFASIIAVGVVYNMAQITLAERKRELATMRVLGLTRAETSFVLLGEVWALAVAAVPFGLILGHWFSKVLIESMSTETLRFPFVLARATYAQAVAVVLLASLASGLLVRRGIDKLDLVAVLKAPE